MRMTNNQFRAYDAYGFRHFPRHLARSGRADILQQMLLDFDWLCSKLDAVDVNGLLEDYELVSGDASVRLVQGVLRMSSHILTEDKRQLPGQLLGRLMAKETVEIKALLSQVKAWQEYPWLQPLRSTLASPDSPLVRTLSGHRDWVSGIADIVRSQGLGLGYRGDARWYADCFRFR